MLGNLGYDLQGLDDVSYTAQSDIGSDIIICGGTCTWGCTLGCALGCSPGCSSCSPGCRFFPIGSLPA